MDFEIQQLLNIKRGVERTFDEIWLDVYRYGKYWVLQNSFFRAQKWNSEINERFICKYNQKV